MREQDHLARAGFVVLHTDWAPTTSPAPRWSRTTQRLLEAAGVDSHLEIHPGEHHAFGPQWPPSMERTVRFLRRHLRS